MDLHDEVIAYLEKKGYFEQWAGAREKYETAASGSKGGWQIPARVCAALGGEPANALPVVVGLGCVQISIVLIDDMLDEDPRGDHHQIGVGLAANMAAALQAAGVEIVLNCGAPAETRLALADSLNKMARLTAIGQYLDVRNPNTEEAYWKMVRMKSSPYYGCTFELGALIGGASFGVVDDIYRLGALYGEMVQIHDDLHDTLATPAGPDWTQGRLPLPILFAQMVDHPERERFLSLRERVGEDEEALREAQLILVRCGGLSYSIDQLLPRIAAAQQLFDQLPFVHPDKIEIMLAKIIDPVRNLMEKIGMPGVLDDAITVIG